MKAVKVSWLGKPLREVYPHATWFQVLKFRTMRAIRWIVIRVAVAGFVAGVLYSTFELGAHLSPEMVYAQVEKQVIVKSEAPVLDRIADCESGTRLPSGRAVPGSGKQFKKDGSVVTHTNDNGSVDLGKFEINMTADHIREMAKLGFNPMTEEGNHAYAEYLYENRGTGDWSSSQGCWRR